MAEFDRKSMLPLVAGLGILAANQPSRAPVSFGSVLGQGGLTAMKYLAQQQAAQQEALKQKAIEDYRQKMLEFQGRRLSLSEAAANKQTLQPFGNKVDAMGRPVFRDDQGNTVVRGQLGLEAFSPELGFKEDPRRQTGQTSTNLIPIDHPDHPGDDSKAILGRLEGGNIVPVTDAKGNYHSAKNYLLSAERADLTRVNARTAQGNLDQRKIDNQIDAMRVLGQNMRYLYPKAGPKIQVFENYWAAKKRGTRQATQDSALILAYLHAKHPDDTTFTQQQLDAVYSELGLAESIGTKISDFFAGKPQLREDFRRDLEDFVLDAQTNLYTRMLILQSQFQGTTGVPAQIIPPPAEEDLGEPPF
jgi:hypothetical protein